MSALSGSHFAQVSEMVLLAPISHLSCRLWSLMALYASKKNPEVWVRQQTYADKLRCSTDSVQRSIKELADQGFLRETKRLYMGRYKTYRLSSNNEQIADAIADSKPASDNTCRTHAVPATAPVRQPLPHPCGTINITASTDYKSDYFFSRAASNANSETESLIEIFGTEWKEKFSCLDGKSGRPSLQECIEQGLAHESRKKYASAKIFLDGWLRNATQRWIFQYNREQNAAATDAALDAEAQQRRAIAEAQRRVDFEKAKEAKMQRDLEEQRKRDEEEGRFAISEEPESEEERAWIISKIRNEIERDRRKAEQGKISDASQILEMAPKEISKANYPLRWRFLQTQWRSARAAA